MKIKIMKNVKKQITSLAIVTAVLVAFIPLISVVSAYAQSNAGALTPISYKTGTYTIAASSLNVRSGPSSSKSKVTTVSKNTSVNVSSVSNGWGKITTGGKTGWIDLSYAYSSVNKVDVTSRLNMLRKKFPDGAYWNREYAGTNNVDGYTYKPCASGHSDKRDNSFDGMGQCHGFATKVGYDLFGIHPSSWSRHYNVNNVVVGDLVRYRDRHTVVITGVYDTYFTVADCNWTYDCQIDWDRKMNKSYISFSNSSYDGVYHCQINNGKGSSSNSASSNKVTAASGTLTITGSSVNVRSGAGTNYSVVTTVKKGASYTYSKETTVSGVKWYYIKVNSSKSGWICGSYVSTSKSAQTSQDASGTLKITGSSVNVRSGAGTNYSVVTQVKKGASYTYSKQTTVSGVKWYYIKVNSSKSGWVCGSYVSTSSSQSSQSSKDTSGTLKINGTVVNVRSGAGTNYSVVTTVKKNSTYNYSNEKTVSGVKWYYIKVSSSKSGWICSSYAKVL